MQQQGDSMFIKPLYNVRAGAISETHIALFSSRSCAISNVLPPVEATYLFGGNSLKEYYNNEGLMKLNYPQIVVLNLNKNPLGVCCRSLQQLRVTVKVKQVV